MTVARVLAARTLVFNDTVVLQGSVGTLVELTPDSFGTLQARVVFDHVLVKKAGPAEWVQFVDAVVGLADLAEPRAL